MSTHLTATNERDDLRMVFKKMLRKLGVGGPSVDTVLADPHCQPGGVVTGEVRLVGGDAESYIEQITLSLVTRVERGERGGQTVEFHRVVVAGNTTLSAGEERAIPFSMSVPWETPITEVGGRPLPRTQVGVRTDVSIAKSVDKGDLDPVLVAPLDSQDEVLEAFGELGFRFRSAELEAGRIHGVRQELPFFQEIEFHPPQHLMGRINEVELTMIANPADLIVVLEADKRGPYGHDAIGRFEAAHSERVDWARLISEWIEETANRRHGMMQHGYEHEGYEGHHGRGGGGGMGGIIAGAAAGVVGGMVLGEILDGDEEGDGFF